VRHQQEPLEVIFVEGSFLRAPWVTQERGDIGGALGKTKEGCTTPVRAPRMEELT
jgi:hypothetical protein